MGLRGPSFGSLHGASCPVLKGDSSDTPNHQQAVLIATEESDAGSQGSTTAARGGQEGWPRGGPEPRTEVKEEAGRGGEAVPGGGNGCAKAQLGRVHCGNRLWAAHRRAGPPGRVE